MPAARAAHGGDAARLPERAAGRVAVPGGHGKTGGHGDRAARDPRAAAGAAYAAYAQWKQDTREKGAEYIRYARAHGKKIAVLCGRPYHIDPEINHGINRLLTSLGMVVISEDCVSDLVEPVKVDVLNQWTYHARLYAAAKLVGEWNDARINLVQLVSFGCGVDAITTDEVRRILEEKNRIYTQIKIDEITNLGAVKIRLRSLFAALGLGKEAAQ